MKKELFIGKLSYDSIKLESVDFNNYSFVLSNYHDKGFKDYPRGKLGFGYDTDDKDNFQFIKKLKEKIICNR